MTDCQSAPHSPEPAEEAKLLCEFCGQAEGTRVGDQYICDDCYIARGSCCAGEDE